MLNSYYVVAYVGNQMYRVTDDLRFRIYGSERLYVWEDRNIVEMCKILDEDSSRHAYKYLIYDLNGNCVGGNK